jgi:hypothetical protein
MKRIINGNEYEIGPRANLMGADLCDADLYGADLCGAYLRGAYLDFASWPLWCGSQDVKVDAKIFDQFVAHVTALVVTGKKEKAIIAYLRKHRTRKHEATKDWK